VSLLHQDDIAQMPVIQAIKIFRNHIFNVSRFVTQDDSEITGFFGHGPDKDEIHFSSNVRVGESLGATL
jgi:hypothetical protein